MKQNRRQWLRAMSSGSLAAAGMGQTSKRTSEYQLFWGDMHNHNAIGYAQGTIERTYDIARHHLDFVAFTPHAQWHDMPAMPAKAEQKWIKGFEVLRANWPKVQKLAAAHNEPGKFVSFLAYEWHSSSFGDYCIYYPGDRAPMLELDHVRKLQQHVKESNAIMIPHHIAYKQGWRGANFSYFDPSVSPVIEIYSEHGLSEHDRGAFDYITHSSGGRWSRNTLRALLKKGIRAGVIASSDDHFGYPGAYGEGLVGVYAKDLSREAIVEAIRARRTIAATGDRTAIDFRVNGSWMGSTLPFAADRTLTVSADAKDEIERIEVVKNDRVIHRVFPEDSAPVQRQWPGEALCRIEFGWGPWGALNMTRVCDWDVHVKVQGARLLGVYPCFQSGPFDEERRNRVLSRTESSLRVQSYTSRADAFLLRATNSVVLHLAGDRNGALEIEMTKPVSKKLRKTLAELADQSEVDFTGPLQSESLLIHRLVTPEYFRQSFDVKDAGKPGQVDWYYARVVQTNGHQAWSSPVWVEG